jgi:SulP family sulfate permease
VREDTAELASYALSDRASSVSPPPRQRPSQTHIESYFSQIPDAEVASSGETEGLRHDTIQEVSEPVSPDTSPTRHSVLTDMIRRSPPSTSPLNEEEQNGDRRSQKGKQDEPSLDEGRLIITSNGLKRDASERTPLLGKNATIETHHPDWIRGEQDLEGQAYRRKASWPKLRSVVLWPKEKGVDIARTVFNPKRWDRKAIWDNAVIAPIGYFPAVVLGLLLNILDALSYGRCKVFSDFNSASLWRANFPPSTKLNFNFNTSSEFRMANIRWQE